MARDIAGLTVWPFVSAQELVEAYAAADVFVFPSLGDPFGIVIEEAHAAGLPVITSDTVGDVRQRVIDGTSGFVVPAGDPAALAERMLTLAANRDASCDDGRQRRGSRDRVGARTLGGRFRAVCQRDPRHFLVAAPWRPARLPRPVRSWWLPPTLEHGHGPG